MYSSELLEGYTLLEELNNPEVFKELNDIKNSLPLPEEIINKTPLSFKDFCIKFLPHYFSQDNCELHEEIIRLAEDDSFESVLIIAPRGFAKSTYCSVALPLWRVCEGLSKFVLLVSDSSTQAEAYLRDIITELEENEDLRRHYGENILPKLDKKKAVVKWCDRDIITRSNCRIAARGTGQKLRGIRTRQYRPDFLVVDDMENDEHVQTPEQRKKTEKWYTSALLNCLEPDKGREFIIGTIIHYDSLLKKLMKNDSYTTRFYKAIKDDGTALWSSRWSLEKLAKKRKKIGIHAFTKEFLNDPLDPETKPFRKEWLKYYTHAEIKNKKLTIYQAIDPAISKKTKADYFVLITIGVDEDLNIYILEIFRKKIGFPEQVRVVREQYKKWNPQRVAVEENGYQAALKEQTLTKERIPFKPIKNISEIGRAHV